MQRFYMAKDDWPVGLLGGDEARHLSQVLRIRAGETVEVFDGQGRRAPADVVRVARDEVALRVGEAVATLRPLPRITLAQAIPKNKNMDLIVRKAVELGVAVIQPLVTNRTVVRPAEHKAEKWRRLALEACKQCGQDHLPEIREPAGIGDWLAGGGQAAADLRLIASLAAGATGLRQTLRAHPGTASATVLIGPEGDFTAGETATALAAGYLPVTLGSIVLRVETAAMFCLSALRYEFGG